MRIVSKVLIGIALCVGLFTNTWAQNKTPIPKPLQLVIQEIVDGQIKAFKSGDYKRAFKFAAPSLQELFGSTDRFIGMVKTGYPAIFGAQSWHYGRSTLRNGELLQEVMLTGPSGRDWVALYTFKKQINGEWRIISVQLKKANALST